MDDSDLLDIPDFLRRDPAPPAHPARKVDPWTAEVQAALKTCRECKKLNDEWRRRRSAAIRRRLRSKRKP